MKRTQAPEPSGLSRRALLRDAPSTVLSLGLLLQGCEFIELKESGERPPTEGTPFSLSDPDYAALSQVGGTACAALGAIPLVLVRANETSVLAFERNCPHFGLSMGPCEGNPQAAVWDEERNTLTCLWHVSVFSETGSRLEGPAPRGLQQFPVRFDPEVGEGVILLREDPA